MSTTAVERRLAGRQPTIVRALHIGRRDHYRLATELLDREPRRVALMQRSSTFVLGPEHGWHDEADFYEASWSSVDAGAEWYHVASTAGIRRHLARPASSFPGHAEAIAQLTVTRGVVHLGDGRSARAIKQLPTDQYTVDFKLDRQARMMVVDFGDSYEAIVVTDIGDRQCSIHQCGPYARELFELCVAFWTECLPLRLADIADGSSPTSRKSSGPPNENWAGRTA